MLTVVDPIQLVPDPPAVQVWIPDESDVRARFPAVPPEITVVCPPRTGRVAIPELGVIADCVLSPAWYDSDSENADPAFVTVVFVAVTAAKPLLTLPKFNPPIPLVTILSPDPVEVVILLPLML